MDKRLKKAIKDQDLAEVSHLIKSGVDINQAEANGTTPLMEAAKSGDLALVELLVEAGAAIDARDGNGKTAAKVAMSHGKGANYAFLVKHSNPDAEFLSTLPQLTPEEKVFETARKQSSDSILHFDYRNPLFRDLLENKRFVAAAQSYSKKRPDAKEQFYSQNLNTVQHHYDMSTGNLRFLTAEEYESLDTSQSALKFIEANPEHELALEEILSLVTHPHHIHCLRTDIRVKKLGAMSGEELGHFVQHLFSKEFLWTYQKTIEHFVGTDFAKKAKTGKFMVDPELVLHASSEILSYIKDLLPSDYFACVANERVYSIGMRFNEHGQFLTDVLESMGVPMGEQEIKMYFVKSCEYFFDYMAPRSSLDENAFERHFHWLKERGVNIDERISKHNKTLLEIAIQLIGNGYGNYSKLAAALVANGAKMPEFDVLGAWTKCGSTLIPLLKVIGMETSDHYGFTPLMKCVKSLDFDGVKELLEAGANPHCETLSGKNALAVLATVRTAHPHQETEQQKIGMLLAQAMESKSTQKRSLSI